MVRRPVCLGLALTFIALAPVQTAADEGWDGRDLRRRAAFSQLEAEDGSESPAARQASTTRCGDPGALLKGKIVPVGISPVSTNPTPPSSTVVTIRAPVPTVGVRLNTVGSGTKTSLIDPIGPLPGSLEYAFASVTGTWTLRTRRIGHCRVAVRGVEFDLGWGDFNPDQFNGRPGSTNLKSVTIPATSPLRRLPDNHLLVKAQGRAVFLLFAEDFATERVPVRSVRLLLDSFDNPAIGYEVPDDGSANAQSDHPPDAVSLDLVAGDGVFTRVLTGLSPGPHTYGFVVNNDGKVRRDPYEEKKDDSTDVDRSVILVK